MKPHIKHILCTVPVLMPYHMLCIMCAILTHILSLMHSSFRFLRGFFMSSSCLIIIQSLYFILHFWLIYTLALNTTLYCTTMITLMHFTYGQFHLEEHLTALHSLMLKGELWSISTLLFVVNEYRRCINYCHSIN